MTDKPRPRGYVWPTWITKLLAGEDRCQWRAWYKTNHKYEKVPEDASRQDFFAEYNKKHDAIVARRAAELRAEGWVVKIEDEGAFKLTGAQADLAGKPDLVAVKDNDAIVIDAKSGKPRESDHWQVLVYMFALGLSWLRGFNIFGEVAYTDRSVPVRALGKEETAKIVSVMRMASGKEEPKTSPSASECKYCDVANCRDRYQARHEGDATRYF